MGVREDMLFESVVWALLLYINAVGFIIAHALALRGHLSYHVEILLVWPQELSSDKVAA